jgi:hypothetical protein
MARSNLNSWRAWTRGASRTAKQTLNPTTPPIITTATIHSRAQRAKFLRASRLADNCRRIQELGRIKEFGRTGQMHVLCASWPGGGVCMMNGKRMIGTETGAMMSISCPLCKAANDTGSHCRRCRADLSLLFAVEAQRQAHFAQARAALAQDEPILASHEAQRADESRHGPDLARFQAVLALLRRDFGEAWFQCQRARTLSAGDP